MKIISVFIFALMSMSYAFADLNENCKQAGGTPPGVKQATKSPPSDSIHQTGVLSPGPISCFCGKKVFTPRPGDNCVDGVIHPAFENFCTHAKGTFQKAGRSSSQCLCGTQAMKVKQCCNANVISACDVSLEPKTWAP